MQEWYCRQGESLHFVRGSCNYFIASCSGRHIDAAKMRLEQSRRLEGQEKYIFLVDLIEQTCQVGQSGNGAIQFILQEIYRCARVLRHYNVSR